jgi:hypothetical protein
VKTKKNQSAFTNDGHFWQQTAECRRTSVRTGKRRCQFLKLDVAISSSIKISLLFISDMQMDTTSRINTSLRKSVNGEYFKNH